jgi:hypothetical protein
MNPEKEEKLIRDLIVESAREMPFSDFEEKLMRQIHLEANTSRSFLKNIKLSWFFFIVGTIFGLFLSITIGQINGSIFGFPAQRLILIAQVIFVILLLTQFDKLIELTRKQSQQKSLEN